MMRARAKQVRRRRPTARQLRVEGAYTALDRLAARLFNWAESLEGRDALMGRNRAWALKMKVREMSNRAEELL